MNYRPSFLFPVALLLIPSAHAQVPSASLVRSSPFLPSGSEAGLPASTPSNFELVGVIATSRHTLVGITDRNTHRSFWIPVGKSAEGIEVVSCNPHDDRAVVRINGELQTLAMHASAPQATAAVNTPVAVQPAPPSGPQAQQEQEARMLVSDLMDISIQQRKAYEESQRKSPPTPSPNR
jgi:hypothetical protein